ncbi:MAG TPA: hypothetical protein VN837_16995 [Chloroflexota bacterium]|nr:hypothetical protein [Chloroflexota bacterium]
MQRFLWSCFIGVILVMAPILTLLGASARATASDMLVLRIGIGQAEGLATVQTGGVPALSLPLGLLDRSGQTLYSARSQSDGTTIVQVISVATSQVVRSMKIRGTFSTRSGDYAEGALPLPGQYGTGAPTTNDYPPLLASGIARVGRIAAGVSPAPVAMRQASVARSGFPADGSQVLSALSFNARWLALREELSINSTTTHFIVIDTQKMRVVADHTLNGQFGLDAISADGRILYLIQSLPNIGFGVYQVRSFEVAHGVLDSKVVAQRGEKPGSMSGEAWTRVWSPDGAWLYTLYVENNGHAFIHALNLRARTTVCLDFPAISSNVGLMAHFTLSEAPDGHALYAVNAALGVAVEVRNLPVGSMRLVHLGLRAGAPMRMQDAAAISADGRRVFVATGSGVWVLDTGSLTVRKTLVSDQEIGSVAISHDGQRLFALSQTSNQIDVLDSNDGSVVDGMQPSPDAWAIEAVQ